MVDLDPPEGLGTIIDCLLVASKRLDEEIMSVSFVLVPKKACFLKKNTLEILK